jgi:hypothetical protein
MFGLIALIVVGVYGFAVIWLTMKGLKYGAQKYTRNTTKDAVKANLCGFVGFALLTAPILWEAVPTYWTYTKITETEGGLKVFKTFEVWKKENPEPAKKLSYEDGQKKQSLPGGWTRRRHNSKISYDNKFEKYANTVTAFRSRLIDEASGEILAAFTYVESGSAGRAPGGDGWWKIWLNHSSIEDSKLEASAWSSLQLKYIAYVEKI